MNFNKVIDLLKKLQEWCNINSVDMNTIDYEYAFRVYEKLGCFDFSIEESLNKNLTI